MSEALGVSAAFGRRAAIERQLRQPSPSVGDEPGAHPPNETTRSGFVDLDRASSLSIRDGPASLSRFEHALDRPRTLTRPGRAGRRRGGRCWSFGLGGRVRFTREAVEVSSSEHRHTALVVHVGAEALLTEPLSQLGRAQTQPVGGMGESDPLAEARNSRHSACTSHRAPLTSAIAVPTRWRTRASAARAGVNSNPS